MIKISNPNKFIRQKIAEKNKQPLHFCFDYEQSYLPHKPIVELFVVVEFSEKGFCFLVSEQIPQAFTHVDKGLSGKEIAKNLAVAWVDIAEGLKLEPIKIPKPWGQEIWYTGIEERGVSQVVTSEGCSPLSWVFAVAPEQLTDNKTPVLLKILDPLPDEVLGDLYFEMHEKKQEVYVVTHVDKTAWPDGEGAIRFGFNQRLRATYASDKAFKEAYLKAVRAYQKVRNEIDSVSMVADEELQQKEQQLRIEMEKFSELKKIQLGDVINVPCFTPHSLQHGVRTVEFQTPVYERKILSFTQKVLTQNHWDTKEALEQVNLDVPEMESKKIVLNEKGVQVEEIVAFEDFTVQRIILNEGASLMLDEFSYQLIFVVEGELELAGHSLTKEECLLLPAMTSNSVKMSVIKGGAIVLKALTLQ